jgi:hypothetical protein
VKFDDKYPDPPRLQDMEDLLFKAPIPYAPRPCGGGIPGACGEPTQWLDASWGLEVPTCSEECREAMWQGYADALRKLAGEEAP